MKYFHTTSCKLRYMRKFKAKSKLYIKNKESVKYKLLEINHTCTVSFK